MELTGELRQLLTRTDWLMETLLKLSKLDAGTVRLAKDTVSVRELISRSAATIAIPMELRNQQLAASCGEEQFTGELTWTAEALGNILKNCMEHTPQGGTITVTAQETALYTQIEVEDTGPGFDTKDIPHLFERFYKGSNASENSYGIGLALARTVITSQNGTVQAMNSGMGAKFVIKFYKQVVAAASFCAEVVTWAKVSRVKPAEKCPSTGQKHDLPTYVTGTQSSSSERVLII